jgi:hypothetical protein
MTQGPSPIYFRPLFWADLFCKLLIELLTVAWCIAMMWLCLSADTPRSLDAFLFSAITGGLCLYSWNLYYTLVERRGLLRPYQFIGLYTTLLAILTWLGWSTAFPSVAIASLVLFFAHHGRNLIQQRYRLWLGHAGRVNKPSGVVRRENQHELRKYPKSDLMIEFGGLKISQTRAALNFLLIGTVGSGKTMIIRMMLQSIVRHMDQPDQNIRIISTDPKIDQLPIIRGISSTVPIYILNPFDDRCHAPIFNEIIRTQGHARAFANELAPASSPGRDDFWRQAMIYMVEGLIYYFTLTAPDTWTWRDVIKGTQSIDRLFSILESHPETRRYAEMLRERGRLTFSIFVTIQTYLSVFAVIAALYDRAEQMGRLLSIKDFLNGSGVLLLGRDPEHIPFISAINRVIFQRLGHMILKRPDQDKATDFFILDEFHTLGQLAVDDLVEFVTNARSRGASILLSVQSLGSLIHLYGDDITYTMLGQLVHKGILYNTDPWTQRWITNLLGEGERFRHIVHKGPLGLWQWIEETEEVERAAIVPAENFARFAQPDRDTRKGLTGLFMQGKQNYWHTYSSRHLKNHLIGKDTGTPAFVEAQADYQRLRPLQIEDLQRLNLQNVIDPEAFREHQRQEDELLGEIQQSQLDLWDILRRYEMPFETFEQPTDDTDDLVNIEDLEATFMADENADDVSDTTAETDSDREDLAEDDSQDLSP